MKFLNEKDRAPWLDQSVDYATLDLGVLSSSPTLGVVDTVLKNKMKRTSFASHLTVFCLGPKIKHLITAVDIADCQPRVKGISSKGDWHT